MGDGDYLLFIYDMLAMESEYDTVEESTLYHKINISMEIEDFFLMVGQLVGMVSFTEELTGAIPSIMRLEKLKFAVLKKEERYLIFLGTSNSITPDAFLKNKLDRFFNIFSFLHGSIQRLKYHKCSGDREEFRNELQEISQCYLSFASYNSIMGALFTPIPTVEFNRASYTIFMKVNEILEACQRREDVYCGTLFSEERVISSQLPEELLHNLMLYKVKSNNLPGDIFYPGFQCPYGINIFKVYVTTKQYAALETVKNLSPYKRQSSDKNDPKKRRKRISRFEDNTKESLVDANSLDISLSNASLDDNSFDSYDERKEMSASQQLLEESPSLSITEEDCSVIDEDNIAEGDNGCSSYIDENDESGQRKKTVHAVSIPTTTSSIVDKNNVHSPSSTNFETLSQRADLPVFHMSSKLESGLEDVRNTDSATETNCDKPAIKKLSTTKQNIVDDMREMHLYMQGHSNIALLLLMKPQKTYLLKSLKSLWEMVLPQLGDIEAQIKSLISTNETQTVKGTEKIGFLQYDKLRQKLRGNVTNPINPTEFACFDSINAMHYQFQNSPSLKDITLRSNLTSVYGHQSHCEEMFYQPRGSYQPVHGPPSNNDATWTFDQRVQSSKLKHIYEKNIIL